MGFFNKLDQPIFLKETNDAEEYIAKLEALKAKAPESIKEKIDTEIKMASYGVIGENNVAFELKNCDTPMYVLRDIHLEIGDLSAQIDFIVITRKLIFLIECKNLFGNIDIDNNGNFTRSYSLKGKWIKEGIYSPITQNERHLAILKQIKKESKTNSLMKMGLDLWFDVFHKSIVVLANPKTILNAKFAKKEIKDMVIRADQLNKYIKDAVKNSKELASNDKDLKQIAENLLDLHIPNKTDYAKKYEDIINNINGELSVDISINTDPTQKNEDLIKKLKAFRLEKSREENVKPYFIFNDAQMMDLIDKMPTSKEALLTVSGIGQTKADKYGDALLQILNNFKNY